jgi:hypothetical protein
MTKHVDVQRLREHESASLVQEGRKKQKTGSKGKTGLSVCSLSSARGAAVLDQNTLDSLKVNARAPSHSLSLSRPTHLKGTLVLNPFSTLPPALSLPLSPPLTRLKGTLILNPFSRLPPN